MSERGVLYNDILKLVDRAFNKIYTTERLEDLPTEVYLGSPLDNAGLAHELGGLIEAQYVIDKINAELALNYDVYVEEVIS